MMEILNFIFSSSLTFFGTVLLLIIILTGLINMIGAWRK